jgi:molybdate transport system ATP-binding protein
MSLEVELRHARADFALEVAMRVDAGGVTALFGPSGAGKSTVIQAVAGLLPHAEGRIVLNGRALLDSAAGVRLPTHRRRIGLVFQDGRLFPHLSVRDNLRYGARRAMAGSSADADIDGAEIVSALGVSALLDRRPATLSGGERQRVALGRALLCKPELLLLDEPLAALDAQRRAEILPYFERLRDLQRIPILYVSHAVDEIARLADRVVALDAGRVTAEGPVEEVISSLEFLGASAGHEPVSVIAATVVGQDAASGLTDLKVGGAPVAAPAFPAAPGARVRLKIRARDVMIALDRPERVSANNVFPATLARAALTDAIATLSLACEGQSLTAQITRRAYDQLGLREGVSVYAVVKSVTIAR